MAVAGTVGLAAARVASRTVPDLSEYDRKREIRRHIAQGVQFRRDSTQKLQRTNDWMQEVLGAAEPGTELPKSRPGQ